jgi:hypothetical protein
MAQGQGFFRLKQVIATGHVAATDEQDLKLGVH